jgi:Uma2 family endonuclease
MRVRTTFADLERMPDDGRRYELYDGEVVVVPTPLPFHQVVVLRIAMTLDAHAERHGGMVFVAPLDIVFSEYDVLQPDVLFFQASRVHLVDLHKVTRSAPDIAIEVLSPSTRKRDRGRKMETYAAYGVKEYWLVDPSARSIERFELEGRGYHRTQDASAADVLRSSVLPQLQVRVESLMS